MHHIPSHILRNSNQLRQPPQGPPVQPTNQRSQTTKTPLAKNERALNIRFASHTITIVNF